MVRLFLISRVQDGLVGLLVGHHVVQDRLVLLVAVAAVVKALLELLLLVLRGRRRIDNLC